jgi:hypothetical protein
MADERPQVDDRDPADAVEQMVAHVLRLAETWGAWEGRPLPADDRLYTPHKAIRRVADHMIDHLAQLESHVAGAEPLPDRWHGSFMTTPADLAPFTPEDLDEARSRARAARPSVAAPARDDPAGGARPGGGRRLHPSGDGVLCGRLHVLRRRRRRAPVVIVPRDSQLEGLVFYGEHKGPIQRHVSRPFWDRARRAAGLEAIRPRLLRHSGASWPTRHRRT